MRADGRTVAAARRDASVVTEHHAAGNELPDEPPTPTAVEASLVQLVNQARAEHGLPPLRVDDRVAAAARRHARVMAEHNAIGHEFPDEPALVDRVATTGITFRMVGENVGRTNTGRPAIDSHRCLMDSEPHRANILGETFDAVGIGVVADGSMFYISEVFVSPTRSHRPDPASGARDFGSRTPDTGAAAKASRLHPPEDGW